jgi:addiction module RelE/StbE family toxin
VKLIFSPTFIRASKRLLKRNNHLSGVVEAALKSLQANMFNPNLRTHKLKGKFENYWSCSVTRDIRIVFKIVKESDEEAILLQSIGTHDEVY